MPINWTDNIRAQFAQYDIDHMKQLTGNALKLDDYESVKTWAGQIWVQVDGDFMPPGAPWSEDYKQNFKTWMDNGMPYDLSSTVGAVTWRSTIKVQFTQFDIDHMKQVTGGTLDLSDYQSTKSNAQGIYRRVSGKTMPPSNPWSDIYIANFKAWIDAGMPEG